MKYTAHSSLQTLWMEVVAEGVVYSYSEPCAQTHVVVCNPKVEALEPEILSPGFTSRIGMLQTIYR